MGERTRWSIVKGIPADEAVAAIDAALPVLPGPPPATPKNSSYRHIRGTREVLGVCEGDVLTLCDDAWRLAQEIAVQRGLFEIELRAQEGDHWDFTLFRGREVLVDFSTRVGYFDENRNTPRPWKLGSPRVLAEAWGVPLPAIVPYLVDWDALPAPRRVTPTSRFASGDWRELFDFMSLLGAAPPYERPDRFRLEVPFWKYDPGQ